MGKQKFTVAGPLGAYGAKPGETVDVDADDPLVQLNITAGVLTSGAAGKDAKPPVMTCPLCVEHGLKTPTRLHTPDELEDHYVERHPGFETPEWRTD
jgi:hypothetical protein